MPAGPVRLRSEFMNGTPIPVVEAKAVKVGYKTTEFWVSIISASLTWVADLAGALPPETAAKVTAAIAAVYAIARGLAKIG